MKFLLEADVNKPESKDQCKTREDVFPDYGRVIGKLEVKILSGLNIKNTDLLGKSDPFVRAYLSNDKGHYIQT